MTVSICERSSDFDRDDVGIGGIAVQIRCRLRTIFLPRCVWNEDRRLEEIGLSIHHANDLECEKLILDALGGTYLNFIPYLDAGTQSDIAVDHGFARRAATEIPALEEGRHAGAPGLCRKHGHLERLIERNDLSGGRVDRTRVRHSLDAPDSSHGVCLQSAG